MPDETTAATQSNPVELIGYLGRIADALEHLCALADRHDGLLDAYQRGGLLAMRTARKNWKQDADRR